MSSNRHHRKPRSRGGNGGGNVVRVDARRHYFWHALFGNMNGDEIAQDINQFWLDPSFKVVHCKWRG